MNRNIRAALVRTVAVVFITSAPPTARGQDAGLARVLETIPARFPVAIVLSDPAGLDAAVAAFSKRTGAKLADAGFLADLRRQIPVLDWIDATQPVGLALTSLEGATRPVLYGGVPDFSAKIQSLTDATLEDGVWRMTLDNLGVYYARVEGDFVTATAFNETVTPADGERSLADVWKGRSDVFRGRGLLVHVNVEPLHDDLVTRLNALHAAAAVLAGATNEQGGAPAELVNLVATAFDAARRVIAELDQLDASLTVSETAISVSAWARFREGSIASYLADARPCDREPFAGLEEQPYAFALDYGFPGERSPFFDFLFDRLAANGPTGADSPAGADAAGGDSGSVEPGTDPAAQATKDLFRGIRGANMLLAGTREGPRLSGHYFGRDAEALLESITHTLSAPNAPLTRIKAGTTFESLGSRGVGGVTVNEFAAVPDVSNPIGAGMAAILGDRPRITFGPGTVGVGVCLGDDAYITRHFSDNPAKPFHDARHVAGALNTLPARRNITLLVDPAPAFALTAPLFGLPAMEPISPGPAVGLAVSLAGQPVRLDLHIPARAIARYHMLRQPPDPL